VSGKGWRKPGSEGKQGGEKGTLEQKIAKKRTPIKRATDHLKKRTAQGHFVEEKRGGEKRNQGFGEKKLFFWMEHKRGTKELRGKKKKTSDEEERALHLRKQTPRPGPVLGEKGDYDEKKEMYLTFRRSLLGGGPNGGGMRAHRIQGKKISLTTQRVWRKDLFLERGGKKNQGAQ